MDGSKETLWTKGQIDKQTNGQTDKQMSVWIQKQIRTLSSLFATAIDCWMFTPLKNKITWINNSWF